MSTPFWVIIIPILVAVAMVALAYSWINLESFIRRRRTNHVGVAIDEYAVLAAERRNVLQLNEATARNRDAGERGVVAAEYERRRKRRVDPSD